MEEKSSCLSEIYYLACWINLPKMHFKQDFNHFVPLAKNRRTPIYNFAT